MWRKLSVYGQEMELHVNQWRHLKLWAKSPPTHQSISHFRFWLILASRPHPPGFLRVTLKMLWSARFQQRQEFPSGSIKHPSIDESIYWDSWWLKKILNWKPDSLSPTICEHICIKQDYKKNYSTDSHDIMSKVSRDLRRNAFDFWRICNGRQIHFPFMSERIIKTRRVMGLIFICVCNLVAIQMKMWIQWI